jgi:hypothetical protein
MPLKHPAFEVRAYDFREVDKAELILGGPPAFEISFRDG